MKVLGIETSCLSTSVAVLDDKNLMGEIVLNTEISHSEKLIPAIDYLLKNLKIEMSDIELIVVSLGPGLFTSLRVGISTSRAFSQSLNIPIIGVSSLDILANQIPYSKYLICPILDAKRKEIYTSLYRHVNKEIKRQGKYYVVSLMKWFKKIKDKKEKIIFIGEIYQEEIKKELKNFSFWAEAIFSIPRASIGAQLGLKKFKKKDISNYNQNYNQIVPLYLRKSKEK